ADTFCLVGTDDKFGGYALKFIARCSQNILRLALNAFASSDKYPFAMLAMGYFEPLENLSGEYRFAGIPLFALAGRVYLFDTSSRTWSPYS
nr:hypothetical protein [Tanacetum cinerariifolium]